MVGVDVQISWNLAKILLPTTKNLDLFRTTFIEGSLLIIFEGFSYFFNPWKD